MKRNCKETFVGSSSLRILGLSLVLLIIAFHSFGQCGTVGVTPSSLITCNGFSGTFQASGGSNYRWYKDAPFQPANLQASGVSSFTPSSSGGYYLVGTDNCNQDQVRPFSITISIKPSIPSIASVTIPYNTSIVMRPSTQLADMESFKWYASDQTTLLSQGAEFYTGNLTAASTTYCVSKDNYYCESTKSVFTVSTNSLPVANAGADIQATLPVSSVTLTGSGSDAGGSVTFQWTRVSGPSAIVLSGVTSNALTLTNIVEGTYVFRLAVTDNINQKVVDDVVFQATSASPANNHNYLRKEDVLVRGISTQAQLSTLVAGEKRSVTDYLDELGKPMETVHWQTTPGKSDVITPVVYDNLGRYSRGYLPTLTAVTGTGVFKKVLDANGEYSGSEIQNLYTDKPYAVTKFDNTPMGRVIEQGSVGQAWQPGAASGTSKVSYGSNVANDIRQWTISANGLPQSTATWAANMLNVSTSTNYVSDATQTVVQEAQNAEGLAIVSRTRVDATSWSETYRVYDQYSNIRFVLPPEVVRILKSANNYVPTQDQVDRWCFQYTYDNLNREIANKGPGTDWEYKIYDAIGRVVLSQDGNQRVKNQWGFTKYDEFNRPVITGIYSPTINYTREDLQTIVNGLNNGKGFQCATPPTSTAAAAILWQEGDASYSGYDGIYKEYQATRSISFKPGFSFAASAQQSFRAAIGDGATLKDGIFPNEGADNLVITYYDNYLGNNSLFQDPSYQFTSENWISTGGDPFVKFDRVKGQVTGSSVRVLNSNGWVSNVKWLNSVIYYDQRQRPIETLSSNHLGQIYRTASLFDFSGKVLETKSSSTGNFLVEWKDLVNAVIESNGWILRKITLVDGWDAGAASINQLEAGKNGWVETQVLDYQLNKMFGLSDANTDVLFNTIDYGIHLNTDKVASVYENGTAKASISFVENDKFKVERIGTTIYYRKNGVQFYQSLIPSTSKLLVDVSLNTSNSKLFATIASFGTPDKSPIITKRFLYDHAGRPLKVYHKLNNQPEVILTANVYNELGQLVDKSLHSTDLISPAYLQSIDYAYNIKGWPIKVNSAAGSDAGETDYFGYEMGYEKDEFGASISAATRKDGLITSTKWRNDFGPKQNLYVYNYDNLGRLSSANFKAGVNSAWTSDVDFYSEKNIDYDYNGNIQTLQRSKQTGAAISQIIDNLSYNYGVSSGNQLMKVTEGSTALLKDQGFKDGNVTNDDYAYDKNGNLTLDANKSIKDIKYNVLDLPEKVTFVDNTYMQYAYDAAGTKLNQTLFSANDQPQLKTDYLGEQVLVNDIPVVIFHDEGRLLPPAFTNLITNKETSGTEGFSANQNVSITSAYQNSQTYVKVVSNQNTSTPGVFIGTYSVKPGEQYSFKVLGYRETTQNAYLYVKGNLGDVVWTGSLLPQGLSNETWSTNEFTVPASTTQITIGVLWSNPSAGATIYINRVALYKTDWEYQYFLLDQVGSPRVVLSTNPSVLNYNATFETENQFAENSAAQVWNIDPSRIVAHPSNVTPGGNEVIMMDNLYRIGPSRSLKVYPGDRIDASVSAYYAAMTGLTSASNAAMSSALIAVMTGQAVPGFDGGVSTAYTNSSSGTTGFLLSPDKGTTQPSAFLNYILFDEYYVPLEAKSVPVGTTSGVNQIISFSTAFGAVNVKEVGYMFVYLSYDNENSNPVYFDELKIIHTESPMVQVNDFYPYGLASYSWIREGEYENRFLFQGKELDPQTGWQDFDARQYDPSLGRWFAPDPGGQFTNPYLAMGTNPVMYRDADGRWINFVIGAIIGGVTSYISGRAAGLRGTELAMFTVAGTMIGLVSSGAGSAVSSSVTAAGGSAFAGAVAGGAVAGALAGGYGNAFAGGDFGRGLWTGALAGAVGGSLGSLASGAGGAMLGGAGSGATNAALNHGDILRGALIGAGMGFVSYHAMALATFSQKSGNAAFDRLSLRDKYKYSRAIQKTLMTKKEHTSLIYGDGSDSKILQSEGEERDVLIWTKGKFRHPVTGEVRKHMLIMGCKRFYNMVDPAPIWNESVIVDMHTHLGFGTTEFSGYGGDLDFFNMKGISHGFMMNGSEIYHWSPTTGSEYVGGTNQYLMRSVFGF